MLGQEMFGQGDDIRTVIPQGRDIEADDVQAVVKILPKATAPDHILQVTVSGSDDAHVDRERFHRPERDYRAFLDATKQLGLDVRFQFPNLVEKQRSAIGGTEEAKRCLVGTGERALNVAEEL